jgi:hypothetical protein
VLVPPLSASTWFDRRNRVGIVLLLSLLAIGGVVFLELYRRAERETQEEKRQARAIARTLVEGKKLDSSEGEKAVTKLLEAKKACEKERAMLRENCADAGIEAPP